MLQIELSQSILMRICVSILGIMLFFGIVIGLNAQDSDVGILQSEVDSLQQSISSQHEEIEALREEAKKYEANIKIKQLESVTLENQLALIENRIAKILIDIQIKEKEIEENNTTIALLTNQIKQHNSDIDIGKNNLARYVQILNETDSKDYLSLLFVEKSFSSFFDAIETSKSLNNDMKATLIGLKDLKISLENEQTQLDIQNDELKVLKQELKDNHIDLEEEQRLKGYYLEETRSSEEKFQELYWQTKQDEFAIRDEIAKAEREIQSKIKEIASRNGDAVNDDEQIILSNPIFSWPVPSRTITASFHDPEYPFRHIFEHPAIDIRASQGTVIRAPADGYVARVRDNGYGYSYVMLVHGEGFSTVYGHVSRIDVTEDAYVRQGDPIGLSGGMPGTPGAGNLSTGAHLHFEIRLNGIPVNPVHYLP